MDQLGQAQERTANAVAAPSVEGEEVEDECGEEEEEDEEEKGRRTRRNKEDNEYDLGVLFGLSGGPRGAPLWLCWVVWGSTGGSFGGFLSPLGALLGLSCGPLRGPGEPRGHLVDHRSKDE